MQNRQMAASNKIKLIFNVSISSELGDIFQFITSIHLVLLMSFYFYQYSISRLFIDITDLEDSKIPLPYVYEWSIFLI